MMNCTLSHTVSFFCVLALTVAASAAEPGLVGWWKLDEGVGSTVADSSDRGHSGSFVAGNPAWVEGKFGGALRFDGVGKVEVPDHADFHLEGAVSVALWANPEATQLEDAKFFCKQKSTYYPYCLQYDGNSQKIYANISSASAQFNTKPTLANFPGQWAHLCFTYDGSALILYKNGEEVARVAASGTLRQNTLSLTIGGRLSSGNNIKGMIDDVRLYNRALTPQEILQVMQGPPAEPVSKPSPATGAVDIPRDVTLHWMPRDASSLHDVYFGTVAAVVDAATRANPNDVLVSQAQDVNAYDPTGWLALDQTCYWRVDEVNTTTGTISKGSIWRFTTEPVSYPVKPVAATASSVQTADNGPEKTIDGSGLDPSDRHSTLDTTMWVSSVDGPQPAWIQYEFDRVYKLHQMWVWNSNQPAEPTVGFGAKDVVVEYSTDGNTWTAVAGVSPFARATGKADYVHNTTVDLGDVPAKYVKLTINSNWGGLVTQFSLSEVRFYHIPVFAREPQPASAATDVNPDVTLSWRAGREAASHQVYLNTDEQKVLDGTAGAATIAAARFETDVDLAQTYYWKVVEVNDAASPKSWEGDVWSFTTSPFVVVDDMESYTDDEPGGKAIYQTWTDGYDTPKTNGGIVGYGKSNNGTFGDTETIHGGKQSMPLTYNNAVAAISEAQRTWPTAQDWTAHGADTLTLYFRGIPIGFLEISPTHILMNGVGADIFDTTDQGRFVYKQLSGNGTIIARVDRIDAVDPWAKAGVMIRRSLDASSAWVLSLYAPGNGFRFQTRTVPLGKGASDSTIATPAQIAVRAPVWIKLDRNGDQFNAYYATDAAPTTWIASPWNPQTLALGADVYIGLAVTSHSAAGLVTQVEFSNITTTGNVTGNWQSVDLGIAQPAGNAPERLYITLEDTGSHKATVVNGDPLAVAAGMWTPWNIPLTTFSSAGVKTESIRKMTIGLGDNAKAASGATGKIYIDDICYGRLISP
jgi:hypothetical protein